LKLHLSNPDSISYREAIECQKRALIGADKTDTYSHQALAELYEILGELAEAAAHHRRCVEISVRAGAPVYQYSKSSIQVARYEMSKYTRDTDTGIALFGPTANTNGQGGPQSEANLSLAREYLEKVATSNTAEVREAEELLRALKLIEDDTLTTK
jgi:anaphase-promoting complex subunit 8